MTAILRILNIVITDSSTIEVSFTENITSNLIPANVSIISETLNVPNSLPLKLMISGNALFITCQPLTPYAAYSLQFQSVANFPFISVNGDAKISQDGVSNQALITGPLPSDNPVMDFLQSFYQNNIYDLNNSNGVISQYMQSIAVNFSRALYDIRQLKNENYLSFTVIDELHQRGTGPFDRLYEEAAYEVFRVGYGPTQAMVANSIIESNFPDYPITLQRQFATEVIKPSSNSSSGTFNIDTLTFNLSNNPITRVNSIIFQLTTATPNYIYNIQDLGYQLLNSEYDQDFASTYLLLANNQVKLNEIILQDPNFSLDQIFNINIQYEYKGLGINVDPNSVNAITTLQSIREVLPPIINIFNLQHAPITDASNNSITLGGVIFTDPNSNTGSPHPAFIMEIPFSLSALPATPGVYAIDYATATAYVYGATTINDGTGPSPPLATYFYRFTYTSQIDYVYDSDLLNIVALPLGNLINSPGTINFNYEQVLIPGTDYQADVHVEAIDERVGNNLIALNALTTQNSPITNVFQIINETSGEIYTLDRWNDNKVYFKYNTPPRITQGLGENATFMTIVNELLGINTTSTNSLGVRIFTIDLANNTIISSTQDSIGSSFNTSLVFANGNVFITELWYDQLLDSTTNVNRLMIGQYTVDYLNGIVYLGVSNTQLNDIGTATYKMNSIITNFPHIVSVDDIYYRISILNPKNKQFSYVSFTDTNIIPAGLDVSDEAFLNGVESSPYQLLQGQIGAFVDATFVPGVSNAVKFIRSVYEYNDLLNSSHPINFANVSASSDFNITVGTINKQTFENVQFDGTNFFITINENIPYLSPGINYLFTTVRTSDSQVFANTILPGNPVKLILSGSPSVGDLINVKYSFTIIPVQRVVVDYNKGDFFIDYTYVADEVLISYEYGDNVLDFRQNTNLPINANYYVSYKVGALRDTLLQNFGTLVNVPDLSNFDLSLERERYREALQAALSSFIQGPTIAALKNIGQIITHIEPQIIESAFQVWSLGQNLLTPVGIETTGSFQLLPAHFGNGALIDQNQTISMPASSNFRLEEGSFETWILPQWAGIDNDASLTFSILRDGAVIDPFRVFIGAGEYHPVISGGTFTLTKLSNVSGLPNTNKDGIFIYYDNDISGNFQRWYVEVIDGYVANDTHTYQFQIISSGKLYDVRSLSPIKPANLTTSTGTTKVSFTITPPADGYGIDEGLTFVSDLEHYILDFGLTKNTNRLSIYKDVGGYLNFRIYDKKGRLSIVSTNISSWLPNSMHMVAASWKLNTRNNRDEMHLFVDGLEIPNIIKYGQKVLPFPGESFRTVDPEQILGLSSRDIVGSDDLITTQGSPTVNSSINFSQFQIFDGDTIFINETGFSPTGYTIEGINGQTLTLNTSLPITLTNGRFSINQTQLMVNSEINIVPNIAVSTIHVLIDGYDLMGSFGSPTFSSPSINFTTQGVLPGYLLRIDNSNFALTYPILTVNGHSLTIIDNCPINLSNANFQIYSTAENEIPGVRALDPAYTIGQDANFNNILTLSNDVFENDLILIKTLGINFQDIKNRYYTWSDGYENMIMSQLPPPISLDQVNITKIILPSIVIGSGNSTLTGGIFISNQLPTDQPSNIITGRTIEATISGTNVDFSSPAQITINGLSNNITISETIDFTNYGSLNFVNPYSAINYIQVNVKPLNPVKNALAVEISEAFPITRQEFDGVFPVIRYSYPIKTGTNLYSDGIDDFVSDGYQTFSALDIGNYLIIYSPISVVGYYIITGISSDLHSISIESTSSSPTVPLASFSNGRYQVLDTTQYRSGLQNGFFTLEISNMPGQPYLLNHGFYQINYATYLSAKFDPLNTSLYLGSDFNGQNQANAILDQSVLFSVMLTDTRIGEVVSNNIRTITKDFNSLKATKPDSNTLFLIDFDNFPFTNDAGFYASNTNDRHFQSEWAVNDNFEQSVVILDRPIVVSNAGILDTQHQGTIEFWTSPLFDLANDPNERYYFDAYGAVLEETVSVSNASVKLTNPASKILSVVLVAGDPKIDYFAGGKLEFDTQNAVQESVISMGISQVIVSQTILQVLTVKIAGDLTGKDYFAGGSVGSDGKTIFLGISLPVSSVLLVITYQTTANKNVQLDTQVIRLNRRLPSQNTPVIVKYLPSGLQGDRISIFKDVYGDLNFSIIGSGINHLVRAPTFWSRNTWHRVKASYKINGGLGNDEMRLFLDGYQYSNSITDGYTVVGDGYLTPSSIIFKDPINDLWIGNSFDLMSPIFTLLDNFRISNLSRPIFAPYGEPLDVNYSNNLATVFPVSSDLYTTYLMDFNKMNILQTNFATLVDRENGSFDFTINIFDTLDILSNSSPQVKQILESLLNILKPANTSMFLKFL